MRYASLASLAFRTIRLSEVKRRKKLHVSSVMIVTFQAVTLSHIFNFLSFYVTFSSVTYYLSPGQTIATSQRNISQHCWPSICKLRANDRNIVGTTYCTRLATLLQRVATCCEFKIELVRMPRHNIVARTWLNDHNIMQHPQMLHEKFDHFQI